MTKTTIQFGFEHYRAGALERIGDAYTLLPAGHFAGSIYFSGRAVEGILRALVWKNDIDVQQGKASLETGHDLRELLVLVRNLGALGQTARGERDILEFRVERINQVWHNNMRFAASKHVETRWLRAGEFGRKQRFRTFKEAAISYLNDSDAVVRLCEALCE